VVMTLVSLSQIVSPRFKDGYRKSVINIVLRLGIVLLIINNMFGFYSN
jgi:hypothetical protein